MSAVSIIDRYSSGLCSAIHGSMPLSPLSVALRLRICEMLSTPPAIIAGTPSTTMRPAAIAIACSPDAQKRFTVVPAMPIGSPARTIVWRATLRPVVPSG